MSDTKTYSVSIPWYATAFIKVKASSSKEAKEKALETAGPSVCCHCSKGLQLDEYNEDGEIDVEEVSE